MQRRVWVFLLLLALAAPGAARADQVQVFIGTSAFTGGHADIHGSIHNTAVVAFPMFALRARHKQYELQLENVPPIGPIYMGSNRYYGVKVGYSDATLRYWLRNGRFAFGIGDSLYVQENGGHSIHHTDRAAGVRYELLEQLPLGRGRVLCADLAVSPSMHLRSAGWIDGFFIPVRAAFGTGSLVDASLAAEIPRGGGHRWVYGVRYLNFTGGNHRPLYDAMTDRTNVAAVFAAWGFRVGRGR